MILFNFGHNNLMGVFCLYVCYSTLRYSTWITSLVYLILPQSLTHSFKLELHLYNGFQQWLEPRSDLYTADQNYLVLCQPQTRTTAVIIYYIILYYNIFCYIVLYIVIYMQFINLCSLLLYPLPYPMPLLLSVTKLALHLFGIVYFPSLLCTIVF